jgi:hypothetical protein
MANINKFIFKQKLDFNQGFIDLKIHNSPIYQYETSRTNLTADFDSGLDKFKLREFQLFENIFSLSSQTPLARYLSSAGSSEYKTGEVVCCTQFIQRDMDVTPLGFPKYKTP